jgi:2-(1,2-epoxy-1,2-dihydrophenyl)acetyl-CoA isomerase
MKSKQYIEIKWIKDDVVELWLNRPEARNAYSKLFLESLIKTLLEFKKNKKLKICLIRGRGVDFCAGGDIKSMLEQSDIFQGPSKKLSNTYKKYIQRLALVLDQVNYLTIAIVQGGAIGAGVGLALACDLIWCSSNAYFRLPFFKLALVPADGSFWRLQKIIGRSKTLEILLSNSKITADKAFDLGIVNKIFSDLSDDEIHKLLSELNVQAFSRADWGEVILLLRNSSQISLTKHLKQMRTIQSNLQLKTEHSKAIKEILK